MTCSENLNSYTPVQSHVFFSCQGAVPQTNGTNSGGNQTESHQGRSLSLKGSFWFAIIIYVSLNSDTMLFFYFLSPFPDGEKEAGEQNEERSAER